MEIIAHRGRVIPAVPGNTMLDFEEAIRLGVTGIETDVSLTIDKVPIIYHPGSTSLNCNAMTWEDLRYYLNELPPIISLDEFLIFLETYTGVFVCLELKQNSPVLIEKVVGKITAKNLENRIYLTSFQKDIPWFGINTNGDMLLLAKKLNGRIKTHVIATHPFNLKSIVNQFEADAISFGWLPDSKLSRYFFKYILAPTIHLKDDIKSVREKGVKVWAGILNTGEDMEYFSRFGVDAIMTDDSILGMKFKKEYQKNSA